MHNGKIVVWGLGKYGNQFINKLTLLNRLYSNLSGIDLLENIEYFVDQDQSKQGTVFCNKEIKSPNYLYDDSINYCVVTIHMNGKAVYEELSKHGIEAVSDTYIINSIQEEILSQRTKIFKKYNVQYLMQGQPNFSELVNRVKKALLSVNTKNDYVLNYLIFSLLIDRWCNSINRFEDLEKIKDSFSIEFIVASMSWRYGYEISELSHWFRNNRNKNQRKEIRPKTIGIVVQRFYGGGIEKVISQLIPMYIQHGHKVILMTDESTFDEEKEYELPTDVIRCFLKYGMEDNQEERIREILQCIDNNEIDMVCFHSGYARIETFYEMLAIKMKGIPTLLEIHSAVQTIMKNNIGISQHLIDMYKIVDDVIVLSTQDKQYLEQWGCKCTYIPNPVDDKLKELKPKVAGNYVDTIVWVGRIVQNPKCVLDTIPIMLKVVKKYPYAKLHIVGNADQKRIYDMLIKGIEENNLQNSITIRKYCSDIEEVYKDADVILLTSVSESFSNVILESKVLGIPLVMYELPWLELTQEGKGFYAVTPRDVDAAAQKIIELFSNDELRKKMAEEARDSSIPFLNYDISKDWERAFKQL